MSCKAIACNVFDYYATPVEYGYDQSELESEIARNEQINWKLKPLSTPFRKNESWYLYGIKYKMTR